MTKRDKIFEKGNVSGLPFTFNQEVTEVFEDMIDRSVPGYSTSLKIIQEQTKLGKIKNEITDVKDELFETQKNLNLAKEDLQEQAVELYINGVMSPSTALFIDLNELSDFLAALGDASSIVDSAYEIVEQLNAFERLAETQTEFLTIREEERETSITNLQEEEEKKNQISIEAEDTKTVYFCGCKHSSTKPFCDGSHAKTDMQPIVFKAEESKEAYLCGCKESKNAPYCDGSHLSL